MEFPATLSSLRDLLPSILYVKRVDGRSRLHVLILQSQRALSIHKADEVDFAGYALQWANFVHHHHWHEETIFCSFTALFIFTP
jgi:hypothetical protein